jgi:predicted amidohydrolase YtcJ
MRTTRPTGAPSPATRPAKAATFVARVASLASSARGAGLASSARGAGLALAAALAAAPCLPGAAPLAAQEADLIVVADGGWTGAEDQPHAAAVAIRGDRILAVGSAEAMDAYRTAWTRVLRFEGGFLTPGFIDNHTHFNSAGALLLGVNLLDVADADGLRARVAEARDRLPAGAWIVGGDWGAYEAWAHGSTGADADRDDDPADAAPDEPAAARAPAGPVGQPLPFDPDRAIIDPVTPTTPALLWRWDRSAYLANGAALAAVGASCEWDGVECVDGEMTGRVGGPAVARIRAAIPPRSMEQRLAEGRAAMAQLRSYGVTTIHDITPPDQFEVYRRLREAGDLTTRVYARPTLDKWEPLAAAGIAHGFGDEWIKLGGLKGFTDGIMGNSSARFYEAYLHTGERGAWRDSTNTGATRGPGSGMEPPGTMLRNLLGADATGHWPHVHAIGDEAIDTLLTLMERVMEENGPRERRFRVIHTQVLRDATVAARMARNGIIAEVQPYHAIDDMRWMEERIGERAVWAYAFRTLDAAGVLLSFGSDWPGTNASWYTANPMHGIYAAVARQTLDGQPEGGWFPQERIDVETALRAYTVNNAYAAGEEATKGRLVPGMLADLVVLDTDVLQADAQAIRDARVLLTVVGGREVYRKDEG